METWRQLEEAADIVVELAGAGTAFVGVASSVVEELWRGEERREGAERRKREGMRRGGGRGEGRILTQSVSLCSYNCETCLSLPHTLFPYPQPSTLSPPTKYL